MRIGICGTSCSGKTTLARELAKSLNYPLIAEVAEYYKEDRHLLSTQARIADTQMNSEMCYSSFVSDRTVYDNMAYTMYWYNKLYFPTYEDRRISGDTTEELYQYSLDRPYDLVVFVDEYFPLEDDGNRSMDEFEQRQVFTLIKNFILDHPDIHCIMVRGSTADRLRKIRDAIQRVEHEWGKIW